jgi:hypothetical protein
MVEVRRFALAIAALGVALAPLPSRADAVQNPVTGDPEVVWSDPRSEHQSDIVFVSLDGGSWPTGTVLSTEGKSEADPRLIIDPTGTRIAVWETSGGVISLRSLALTSEEWSDEVVVSDPTVMASHPSIALVDGATFVGYESAATGSTGDAHAVVAARIDPGGNVERTLVATSASPQSLAPLVHSEGANLWVDWVDSETSLGFAVYGADGWSVDFEPVAGPADVGAGRARIKDLVLQGR